MKTNENSMEHFSHIFRWSLLGGSILANYIVLNYGEAFV